MFSVYCSHHEARVLLGPRSIEALADTPDGVVVHWRCRCGTRGALLPAGRHTARTSERTAA